MRDEIKEGLDKGAKERDEEVGDNLTSRTCSSSSSLNTVPDTWFGFRGCQFSSGIRCLVWMGLRLLPPVSQMCEYHGQFLLVGLHVLDHNRLNTVIRSIKEDRCFSFISKWINA